MTNSGDGRTNPLTAGTLTAAGFDAATDYQISLQLPWADNRVVWTSSNPTVATVSTLTINQPNKLPPWSSLINVLGVGSTIITATSLNNPRVSTNTLINVVVPVRTLTMYPPGAPANYYFIRVTGPPIILNARIKPLFATVKTLKWTCITSGDAQITITDPSNSANTTDSFVAGNSWILGYPNMIITGKKKGTGAASNCILIISSVDSPTVSLNCTFNVQA